MTPLVSHPTEAIAGTARIPGDKSISHRSVLFGGLAVGETRITGLLEGEDVKRTIAAMTALGCSAESNGPGSWTIAGCGIGGLRPASDVLDMGNSGTAARLLLGILASHPFSTFLTGDHSLRSRPMARVTGPLSETGAAFVTSEGGRLPLAVTGPRVSQPITYTLPVASAQVKSAVLLAGLNAPGETTVIEPAATRDHTERMLTHFGGMIRVEPLAEGNGRAITVTGQPELTPSTIAVPADISSAAFAMTAALIIPDSEITLPGIGMNPGRTGLITTLQEMGARLAISNERDEGGEPVADIVARTSELQGIEVPADRAPSMIDEYPILAAAAACANGRTVMHGLAELRVKESDRLGAIARGLAACGIEVHEGEDTLEVEGAGGRPAGGATVETHYDHRIAMSFLVLGMAAEKPVTIDDATAISTSFPGFTDLMNELGGKISSAGAS